MSFAKTEQREIQQMNMTIPAFKNDIRIPQM